MLNGISIRSVCLLSICLLGAGCTQTYHPQEYTLKEDRIEAFEVSGPVSVDGGKDSTDVVDIFGGPITWNASYAEIGQALSSQLQSEIDRHGKPNGGSEKNLAVAVSRFHTEQPGFVFKTFVDFTVTGDKGFSKSFNIEDTTNGSVGGNIVRSFNGAIAVSVIHILQDEDVLRYLSE